MSFKLTSDLTPRGDQPKAIRQLVDGLRKGLSHQVLYGITGSGKTFVIANVIAELNLPTIIIEPNKTLAAQITAELRSFLSENAVEYYVSYYDYYQPEAYVPSTDTYIAKDYSINEEIEKFRISTMKSLATRRDVAVVATVSCLYPAGSPEDFRVTSKTFRVNQKISRENFITDLIDLQYERNDFDFHRGTFRVRGDIVDLYFSYSDEIARFEFFGDMIDKILILEPYNYKTLKEASAVEVFSGSRFITTKSKIERALTTIEDELNQRLRELHSMGKHLYAERLEKRTRHDMEMLKQMGFCTGIENYSRHFDGRTAGQKPYCLLDHFNGEFLIFIDESHLTIPQIHAMAHGDYMRKKNLVDYGFRLPSAYDNRPITFEEFEEYLKKVVYVSATPGEYEFKKAQQVVELIIRPTGLLDPVIEVRETRNQIDDLISEINKNRLNNERTLVTTLTKRMAEELSEYLIEAGIKAEYLHSEVDTIERVKILRNLRSGKFEVVVGINLLREGLDLPEVSLIAILDADKEGFLRSDTSLTQIIGRASRNINGRVILYADEITDSMRKAIEENNRRRRIQLEYNQLHGIIPVTITKKISDIAPSMQETIEVLDEETRRELLALSDSDIDLYVTSLKMKMNEFAENLEFEKAAEIRDKIKVLEKNLVAHHR
ncbi:MAG: excinuclease ABC subunit UvrB [Candidatus Odinarchaeota archaeon]